MKKAVFLSVIIPVYNESKRLEKLPQVISYLKRQKIAFELLVVNDGSKDSTLKQLKEMQKNWQFRIISYLPNHGKGYAIKKGMLFAKGKYRLFLDVDLSTPMAEWQKFLPFLEKYDLIIASRKAKGSKIITRQPWLRETLGRGFTLLSQIVLGVRISDITCGFKCFSAQTAEQIFKKLTIARWGFDPEIFFLAKKLNFSIKEIPIAWENDHQTKVKFPQDLIRSFTDLITIRLNDLQGKYEKI